MPYKPGYLYLAITYMLKLQTLQILCSAGV